MRSSGAPARGGEGVSHLVDVPGDKHMRGLLARRKRAERVDRIEPRLTKQRLAFAETAKTPCRSANLPYG